MMLVHDAGSLVFVWEGDRMRMILHAPDVRSCKDYMRESVATNELTPTELRILPHIVEGMSNEEIGAQIGVTCDAIRRHVINLMRKLGARNRVAIAVHCVREGLVE